MKKQLFAFFVLFISVSAHAQDGRFTQKLFTRALLNPGIAGTDSTLVFSLSVCEQPFIGFQGKPSTKCFAADQYVRPLRGGIGFAVVTDEIGAQSSKQIDLTYAPHFELLHHKLALQSGLTFGYSEKTIRADFVAPDGSSTATGGGVDPSIPWTGNKLTNFNLDAGIFIYTKKLYGGIAVKHINQPDNYVIDNYGQLYKNYSPYKLNLNAGANLCFKKDTNQNFTFSPNIFYEQVLNYSNPARYFLYGVTAKYKYFLLGVTLSGNKTILNIGFQNRFFKLGYSYNSGVLLLGDFTSYGQHELHLMCYIPYRFHKTCPIKTFRFI